MTRQHRVVVLGGLAVIAHGLSRSTCDGDIWLNPMSDVNEQSAVLGKACLDFGGLILHSIPGWIPVSRNDDVDAIHETNMVRILGLECPLDVFRKPNEIRVDDFDVICGRALLRMDGTPIPDSLDLIQSQFDTGYDKDIYDIQHLESVVRANYQKIFPQRSGELRARRMKTAVKSPDFAKSRRPTEHSSFQHFSSTQTPLFFRLRSSHELSQRPSRQKANSQQSAT